jgi:hypothetical protein
MLTVSKGLVIDQPWIDLILSGRKTWEMRATGASYRGWFGLIRKGSGMVWGVARIESVGVSLSPDEMVATHANHHIPEAMIRSGEVAKWTTPWKLADVTRLPHPVSYNHPYGAVTWVTFDAAVSAAIVAQLDGSPSAAPVPTTARSVAAQPAPQMVAPKPDTPKAQSKLTATPPQVAGTLLGETELNAANLKNSHFYLTPFLGRFPTNMIGGTNDGSLAPAQALIDWGGSSLVETDIPSDKKMFRRRGWVRQFFADNDAKPGDRVRVHQTAPYRYLVTLVKGAA